MKHLFFRGIKYWLILGVLPFLLVVLWSFIPGNIDDILSNNLGLLWESISMYCFILVIIPSFIGSLFGFKQQTIFGDGGGSDPIGYFVGIIGIILLFLIIGTLISFLVAGVQKIFSKK